MVYFMPRYRKPPPIKCELLTSVPNIDDLELMDQCYFANRYEHCTANEAEKLFGRRFPGFAKQARLLGKYARNRFVAYKDGEWDKTPYYLAIAEECYRQLLPEYQWRTTTYGKGASLIRVERDTDHTVKVSDRLGTVLYECANSTERDGTLVEIVITELLESLVSQGKL